MARSEVKKPSLEGLEEAKAILKKVYEKGPSDELLEIVSDITDEEDFHGDEDDEVAAKSKSSGPVETSL